MLREEIRNFLKSRGLKLNTDLGQHFLTDEEVLRTIIESAQLDSTDTVVEIGPGIGILTEKLVERAGKVIAIELDTRLIPLLRVYVGTRQLRAAQVLTIIEGNALSTSFPDEPYKVVANIPYHITSPLLRHLFLESTQPPKSMTLLIQREVAETICSTDDAGMLTILIGLFGNPRIAAFVPKESFLPPPQVASAVLHVECFDQPKAGREEIEEIFRLTRIAFGQRRKMLSNTLGSLAEGEAAMKEAVIDPKRRPQTLSVDEWIALARIAKRLRQT